MAGKLGMKKGIEREVLACLSKTSGSKTAPEIAREINRTVGRVREWLQIHEEHGRVVGHRTYQGRSYRLLSPATRH